MVIDVSLVPPGRLGALLSSKRQEIGIDLATLATKSGGEFDVISLEAIEKGWSEISEDQIESITNIYELESGNIIPQRSRLIVDLDGQTIKSGEQIVEFKSQQADEVLEQYISLLYLLRDIQPGEKLTFRQPDLLALKRY